MALAQWGIKTKHATFYVESADKARRTFTSIYILSSLAGTAELQASEPLSSCSCLPFDELLVFTTLTYRDVIALTRAVCIFSSVTSECRNVLKVFLDDVLKLLN